MNLTLRKDADAIIASSLNAVLPDEAVRRALKAFAPKGGRVLLVAAGKAGRMADGTRGSGSAGPCGRRRGRDQIRACQGRNSGRKLL